MSSKTLKTSEQGLFNEEKFRKFQLSETSSATSTIRMNIMGNLVLFSELIPILMGPFSKGKVAMLLLMMSVFIVGWVLCFVHYKIQMTSCDANSNIYNLKNLALIQDCFVVILSIYYGGLLLYKSTKNSYGTCNNDFISRDHSLCHLVPTYYITIGLMFPLHSIVHFKGVKWLVLMFSSCLLILMIGNIVIRTKSMDHIFTFMFLAPVSTMLMFELRRQNVEVFKLTQSLQIVIKENEAMAEELRLNEMKMIIGNVAHDLNTPLSALMSGLEELETISENIKDKLNEIFHIFNSELGTKPLEITINTSLDMFENAKNRIFDFVDMISKRVKTSKNVNSFMLMTIHRCIDFAKVKHGVKLIARMETTKLDEEISSAVDCMHDLQTLIPINVSAISSNLCNQVITDRLWFKENLLCLLSNAVKYCSKGVVSVNVSLWKPDAQSNNPHNQDVPNSSHSNTNETQEYVRLEVEDPGVGISADEMANLFTPFKQAQRLTGGTGLGLYSLAKRMDSLDGLYGVGVRSDGERGCKFWFAFPYRPDKTNFDTTNTEDSQSDKSYSESAVSFQGLNILLVDDSLPIRKVMINLLTGKGHTTVAAIHGEDGIEKWIDYRNNGKQFDVILMDMQMPIMDGVEATRRIRNKEAHTSGEAKTSLNSSVFEIRRNDHNMSPKRRLFSQNNRRQIIIALSANSDSDTIAKALEMGVDEFMPKPFMIQTFYNKLEKILMKENPK